MQGLLIAHAQDRPFPVWRSELQALVSLLDQDGPFDPNRELARNHLHVTETAPGEIRLSGVLVGEHALTFTEAVRVEGDRVRRQMLADHAECGDLAMPSGATITAIALCNLTRRGRTHPDTTTRAPVVDITLIMRADQPDAVYTLDGDRLNAERYRHLFCDAAFTAVIVDRVGVPLGLGRTARYATPAQRRALIVRDGGCVFPGCDAPASWCDAHHVDHWEHDGRTDLDNLALLCRHHHGVSRQPSMSSQPAGVRTSRGAVDFRTVRHHRQGPVKAGRRPPVGAALRGPGCTTGQLGERSGPAGPLGRRSFPGADGPAWGFVSEGGRHRSPVTGGGPCSSEILSFTLGPQRLPSDRNARSHRCSSATRSSA
jgi:hypothetical protein